MCEQRKIIVSGADYLRFPFPLMAISDPLMALSRSGSRRRKTKGGPPGVHRKKFPGPPIATGEIPWIIHSH